MSDKIDLGNLLSETKIRLWFFLINILFTLGSMLVTTAIPVFLLLKGKDDMELFAISLFPLALTAYLWSFLRSHFFKIKFYEGGIKWRRWYSSNFTTLSYESLLGYDSELKNGGAYEDYYEWHIGMQEGGGIRFNKWDNSNTRENVEIISSKLSHSEFVKHKNVKYILVSFLGLTAFAVVILKLVVLNSR